MLLVFSVCTSAGAFQAEVLPSEINPGDAFVIKVTGVRTSHLPAANLNDKLFYFSSCGERCFVTIGAVGIEANPGVHTVQLNLGEIKTSLKLVVKQVSFPTINLTLPPERVFLSPENQKRAEKEAERLKSIWQIVTDKLWDGKFILPLENKTSTAFGVKRIINKEKTSIHKGVDIKGNEGEKVKASNRGRVVLAEELFFGGNTIILDHGHGIYTIYMHLSKFKVKTGSIVSKGDVIGLVGSSGRASGPHLHFGIKVLNINTNPVSFVKLNL